LNGLGIAKANALLFELQESLYRVKKTAKTSLNWLASLMWPSSLVIAGLAGLFLPIL